MKKWVVCLLAGYIGLALPTWWRLYADRQDTQTENITTICTETEPVSLLRETTDGETIAVFKADEKTVQTMTVRAYIIGVVAAEMPASWHTEALCAQALASLNYARRSMESGNKDYLNGGVISTDSAVNQGYYDEADMRRLWGTEYDYYRGRIETAVDTVLPYGLVYDGELCLTCYHAISAGKTESSENVFNTSVAYLTAVDSGFDEGASGYKTQLCVTESKFRETLGLSSWCAIPGDTQYTPSGTLVSLTADGKTVSGATVQSAFGLRSRAVTFSKENGNVILTVYGYGHGVGMSQYGAQVLAGQGYTWEEILAYYYPGANLIIMQNESGKWNY